MLSPQFNTAPSVGEVYNPIIDAVLAGNDNAALNRLLAAASGIMRHNEHLNLDPAGGLRAACGNLWHYAGFFGDATSLAVRTFIRRVEAGQASHPMGAKVKPATGPENAWKRRINLRRHRPDADGTVDVA